MPQTVHDYVAPMDTSAFGRHWQEGERMAMEDRRARDQMAQQRALAAQAQLERAREFNARVSEWGGEDTVTGPDGVADIPATAKARQARADREALAGAAGSNSVWSPDMAPPSRFMSPEMQQGAMAVGDTPAPAEVGPTEAQLADPHYMSNRAAQLKVKGTEQFRLDQEAQRARELFDRQRALMQMRGTQAVVSGAAKSTQKMVDDLQRNDPSFDQSAYDLTNPDDLNEIKDRHNQVMTRVNFGKSLPPAARLAVKTPEELAALGVDANQADTLKTAVAGGNRLTGLQKNTAAYEKRLRDASTASGQPVDDGEIQAKVRKYVENAGKIPQLVPAAKKDMDESAATIDTLDTLLGGVSAFNQKYGKDAFDSYLGWLPKNKIQIENALTKATDPKEVQALQLLGQFAGMRNGVLKGTSGQAVTESEAKRMAQQIGDSGDKNSLSKLAQFRTDTARRLAGSIKRNAEYQLPKYYEDWIASEAGGKNIALPTDVNAAPVKKTGRFIIETE